MTAPGRPSEDISEVLSGIRIPAGREALHDALDSLLDAADQDGGRLDGPDFWIFMAALARGRGIADEIADAAAANVADHGGLPAKAAEAWRAAQWAMLSGLLNRLTTVGEIMPKEFSAAAFRAVALNVLVGGRGGEAQDLLGLGTQRGTPSEAEVRAAKRLLVGAVFFRAEQKGQSVAAARRVMLPDIPDATWKGWTRDVAAAKGVTVREVGKAARGAARGEDGTDRAVYDLDADEVARLLRMGWRPNA